MVFYLIDLLHESNIAVVKAADQALDIVNDLDEEWAAKLRALKFEAHNEAWLEACANSSNAQQVGYASVSVTSIAVGLLCCN